MSSRVIGGSAKGRRLKTVSDNRLRPIMDRVKEALFNILGNAMLEARVLDLFAGTGAVGIEALSRGANHATFVDVYGQALKLIHENLKLTRLQDRAQVLRQDAFDFIPNFKETPYSFVYIAPPQYQGLWKRAILAIDKHAAVVLEPDALVVVQIDPKEQAPLNLTHLIAYDERRYGNTLLLFFEYTQVDEA